MRVSLRSIKEVACSSSTPVSDNSKNPSGSSLVSSLMGFDNSKKSERTSRKRREAKLTFELEDF
jgi:hypothetical protein